MTCAFQLQGNIGKGIFDVIDDGLMVVNRALASLHGGLPLASMHGGLPLASLHGGLLNNTIKVSLRGFFNYFKIRKYT